MSQLLDRDFSLASSSDVRNQAGPVLREVIDYGLRVFQRCSATAEGHDTPLGVLFPFLHCLEMLDGTEVLLGAAADVPGRTTLRSAFEALLAMEWVACEDSERRGAAYVVAEVHRRFARSERFDPTTERGKQLRAVLAKDAIGSTLELPDARDEAIERADVRSVLQEPHLVAASAEYDRTKALLKRTPEFYALWDGPRDLEHLAQRLGRAAYYEILYRPWSGTAHANDLGRQLRRVEGEVAISRLRNGEGLIDLYAHSIHFGLQTIQIGLTKYRPDELQSYWTWYKTKVSSVYTRLTPRPEPVAGESAV